MATEPNPLSRVFEDTPYPFVVSNDSGLQERYELEFLTLTISPEVKIIHVDFIIVFAEVRGCGHGSRFFRDLCDEADRRGYTIGLSPCMGYGASSLTRLQRFYRRFGFRRNRGRYADPQISNTMIRKPKEI